MTSARGNRAQENDMTRKSPDNSEVILSDGATTFVGDATHLFRATVLRQALGALALGRQVNRAYTLTNTLKAVGGITGKKYARSITSIPRARADLDEWIAAAKASMPVTDKRTGRA
jgi:hypothetical protein